MTDTAISKDMSRIHLDGAINFGHIVSVILTLTAIVAGWVTLDARVATLERDYRTQKVDVQASTVSAEVRLQGQPSGRRVALVLLDVGDLDLVIVERRRGVARAAPPTRTAPSLSRYALNSLPLSAA
jgi:hypothetical protein